MIRIPIAIILWTLIVGSVEQAALATRVIPQ